MQLVEAIAYIDKGIEKAVKLDLKLSFAVVDEFGMLVQFDHMDGASLMSADVAPAKAATSLNFRRPTSEVKKLRQVNPELERNLEKVVHFKLVALGGGAPIFKNGAIYGAIGVSGGTEAQDEEVATHAIS
jgi:glc operon protein GlcG